MNKIEELELKLVAAENLTAVVKKEIDELKNKPKYEVGKWYKTDTFLVFIERFNTPRQANVYGLHKGNWLTSDRFLIGEFEDFTEATNDEVQTALIKEAKKRGFKEGVWFDNEKIYNHLKEPQRNKALGSIEYLNHEDGVLMQIKGKIFSNTIFYNGKWATIIDTPLTINGKKVTIGKGFISIGCKSIDSKRFKTLVEELTNLDITDFNHPEVGNVTTKQFQEICDMID